MNKRLFLKFSGLFLSLVAAFVVLGVKAPHALADYAAADLISDSNFTDNTSMTSGDIQNFLNSKNSGIRNYTVIENCNPPTAYPAPYSYTYYPHCGSTVSAATLIYDAAQAYHISPRVILATMQKEESLVTDPNPSASQLSTAMGYGCPSSCNSAYQGFFNQIDWGTWQFRTYIETMNGRTFTGDSNYACASGHDVNPNNNTYSTGLFPGRTVTFYDPGGTAQTITLANSATAALYCYTPFVGPINVTGYSGSYNFVTSYEAWWGESDVQYSWSIQSVSYSTNANVFGTGITGTVTVKAANNGSVYWYNYGANPIRLGTWQPGRQSALYSPGWLSPDRPANMTENQVAPGGTATFTFPVTVNSPGTYVEALNLVVENSQWMPWPGLSPTIIIKQSYAWQVSSVSYGAGTGLMNPGTSQTVTVKALNTGWATWSSSSGPPIRLGTWLPERQSAVAQGWISPTRAVSMTEASVDPGQTGTFTFNVYMPNTGLYYERMNLVAEGQSWFNDAGLTLYLKGASYAWKPLWSAYSTGGDANLARGTSLDITVKALNTGEATWTQTTFPVRLATVGPLNRGTMLYDSSWINSVRPATMLETSVAPGQQATFVFHANIPSNTATGPRFERFSLVAEGIQWFNDPGFSLYFNLH